MTSISQLIPFKFQFYICQHLIPHLSFLGPHLPTLGHHLSTLGPSSVNSWSLICQLLVLHQSTLGPPSVNSWPRCYKTWVQSGTQNKAQWLAACGHVSASSQSLRFISSPEPKAHWWANSIPVTPASVRPSSVNIFKHLFWNYWANWTQISYGDSLGWGNESLFKWSWSHDQDGRHAHIW